MNEQEVQTLIASGIKNSKVWVQGEGAHFDAVIIADVFLDKSKIEQQKIVYQVLGDRIKNGEIHAISMKTYTPEQWLTLSDKPVEIIKDTKNG